MQANLILHTGASTATREQVQAVATPERTETWVPISHEGLLQGVIGSLNASGLHIVTEAHGLTKGGNRYFGLLQVANGDNPTDWGLTIGVRNSHDRSYPAGLVLGASVFVCDNLSFSGEVKLARKHTAHIERDLPQLVDRAVGLLGGLRRTQEERFTAYKHLELTNSQAHDLVIQALDSRILPVTQIPDVLEEFRHPRHPEFAANGLTGWRLWNAFSETLKGRLTELPKRTTALHGLMDAAAGLVAPTGFKTEDAEVQVTALAV